MNKVDVLLGLQWGDEGKGKIVDVLAPNYDIIARFQGGPNAGHTLVFDGKKYVLHCLPSGVFQVNTINLIGNGMVLDPVVLQEELAKIKEGGYDVSDRILVAQKTHLILPTHRLLDAAHEKRKGKQAIGSTLRGIGPAYTDKVSRHGLRAGDIFAPDFETKLENTLRKHEEQLSWLDYEYDLTDDLISWRDAIEKLKNIQQVDDSYYLSEQLKAGKRVLAEGAQGTLLDISYGSYPFVTSSHTIAGGVCTGLGIAPSQIGKVYGVFKAYCTRVGSGPFPTELTDEVGIQIQKNGNEFGSTTGRERRCGWLDIVALKYACMINGVTDLFMMKSDVLSGLSELKVGASYKLDGTATDQLPYDMTHKSIEPKLETLTSWKEDVTSATSWNKLPQQLKEYVSFIEDKTSLPITVVSVGPDRKQTIVRGQL